ncbi:AMIN-like domain-containing (lipo)protein [Actinocrispum wychmicini]|uniref:AMIN-like domain-containing protein n=1 Tax=Actinocrispum wychmicini TaxID=1213861 RepID=A0A4R2J3A6_9PSEU|nr:hypothetical protein [Actinocrispum wychmicini]TCO49815.1 hypothetical protein EV192_114185 [Actinocrispum wychmicini]
MIIRTVSLMVGAIVAVVLAVPMAAAATAPYCGITWGSLPKSAPSTVSAELVGLRAGQHDCYDRLVFDFRGAVDGFNVSYVDQVTMDPSGAPVPLRGGARLAIVLRAPAYDQNGNPTYVFANPAELVNLAGFQTFRQAAWAGSFEAVTTVGLGVRARLPFRVFTLPDRIVVDVAHFW